jgi:hypothetical protein
MKNKERNKEDLTRLYRIAHSKYRQKNFWEPKTDQEFIMYIKEDLREIMNHYLSDDIKNLDNKFADFVLKIIDFCETRDIKVIEKMFNIGDK